MAEIETYDAGLLNDWGGGNVQWWQDYIRAELGRSQDFYEQQFEQVQKEMEELKAAFALKEEVLLLVKDYVSTAISMAKIRGGSHEVADGIMIEIDAAISPSSSWLAEHDRELEKRTLREHGERNKCEMAELEAVAIDDLPDERPAAALDTRMPREGIE